MPPLKCQYHDCDNTNNTKSMFSFPVNDEPRLKLWIQHSGNINLTSLTHQELKRRYICEDHFKTEDVSNNNFRSRLLPAAVPLKRKAATPTRLVESPEVLKIKTPQKCYHRKRIDLPPQPQENSSPCSSMLDAPVNTKQIHKRRRVPSEGEDDQPEVKRLKKLAVELKAKNRKQQSQIRRLSLKANKKKRIILESLRFSNDIAKTMAMMQLRRRQSRRKWTKTERELCLSIYYKSPSAYVHMRRKWEPILIKNRQMTPE
ncbi:uncharacterized protein LOC125225553 [Leguminivora glycinivorella]|uniref:uncharacterized protein LOC125225553 n=1 Tax=Leguminivora glycinivorella TaxID=1035111 RepID=UPI00200F4F64|nr:uncharacterized protein LOC125225553 [Leguminivora glycinivorella]